MHVVTRLAFLPLLLLVSLPVRAGSPFDGRWRLDTARSSALDGWNSWDLVIAVEGSRVSLRHDMQWRSTKVTETNVVDTAQAVVLERFFRVEQRHAAVYPARHGGTTAQAAWLDGGRTLRLEAVTPVEVSQGDTTMRIYSEYRLLEGDAVLLLLELHSTRSRPLVYRFNKVSNTP